MTNQDKMLDIFKLKKPSWIAQMIADSCIYCCAQCPIKTECNEDSEASCCHQVWEHWLTKDYEEKYLKVY